MIQKTVLCGVLYCTVCCKTTSYEYMLQKYILYDAKTPYIVQKISYMLQKKHLICCNNTFIINSKRQVYKETLYNTHVKSPINNINKGNTHILTRVKGRARAKCVFNKPFSLWG